jgi:hypothetical protein
MRNIEKTINKINYITLYNKFRDLTTNYKLLLFIPYTVAAIVILPIVLLTYVVKLIIKTINLVILTPLLLVASYLSSTSPEDTVNQRLSVKGKIDDIVVVTKEEKIESFSPNPNFTADNKADLELYSLRIEDAKNTLELYPKNREAKHKLELNQTLVRSLPALHIRQELKNTSIKINDYYIHYVDTTGFDANTRVIDGLPDSNFLTILLYALIRLLYNMFIIAITAVEFFVLDWSKFFSSHVTCSKLSSDLLIFGFILLNVILMNLPIGYAVLTSLVTTALFNNSSKHKLLLYSAAWAVFAFYFLYSLEITSLFPYLLVAFLAYSSLANLHKNYTAINNKLFFTLSFNILLFAILGLASIAVPYFYAVSVFNIIGLSQPAVFMIINAVSLLSIVFESVIDKQKYTPLKEDDAKTTAAHVEANTTASHDLQTSVLAANIDQLSQKQTVDTKETPPSKKTPNTRNETPEQKTLREARVAAYKNRDRARNQPQAQVTTVSDEESDLDDNLSDSDSDLDLDIHHT